MLGKYMIIRALHLILLICRQWDSSVNHADGTRRTGLGLGTAEGSDAGFGSRGLGMWALLNLRV